MIYTSRKLIICYPHQLTIEIVNNLVTSRKMMLSLKRAIVNVTVSKAVKVLGKKAIDKFFTEK